MTDTRWEAQFVLKIQRLGKRGSRKFGQGHERRQHQLDILHAIGICQQPHDRIVTAERGVGSPTAASAARCFVATRRGKVGHKSRGKPASSQGTRSAHENRGVGADSTAHLALPARPRCVHPLVITQRKRLRPGHNDESIAWQGHSITGTAALIPGPHSASRAASRVRDTPGRNPPTNRVDLRDESASSLAIGKQSPVRLNPAASVIACVARLFSRFAASIRRGGRHQRLLRVP